MTAQQMIARVELLLESANLQHCKHGSFFVQKHDDTLVSVFYTRKGRDSYKYPERVTMLLAARQVLLPHFYVALHGSHYKDGGAVCLDVRERHEETTYTADKELSTSHA